LAATRLAGDVGHLPPRRFLSRLNAHFDVKHIKHDLHHGGMDDPDIYELAGTLGRIILTINVKDFRPLLRDNAPGVIGIPEGWSAPRIDTKLTAFLMHHSPAYFRGRYHPLATAETHKKLRNSCILQDLENRELPLLLSGTHLLADENRNNLILIEPFHTQ
jgi:hypothetical protein